MIKIYEASSVSDAYIFASVLDSEGIEAQVCNDRLMGLVGELPYSAEILPIVAIYKQEDYKRALELAQEYSQNQESLITDEWVCKICSESNPSNFELCWNCQTLKAQF